MAERQPVAVVVYLVAEVAITGSLGAGDDGYALGKAGQREFALEVEDACLLELADYLHALAHDVAQGVVGVYVAHLVGETVGFVEGGRYHHPHLDARPQLLLGLAFKLAAQCRPAVGPAHRTGLGQRGGTEGVVLHEFHIAVAAVV